MSDSAPPVTVEPQFVINAQQSRIADLTHQVVMLEALVNQQAAHIMALLEARDAGVETTEGDTLPTSTDLGDKDDGEAGPTHD